MFDPNDPTIQGLKVEFRERFRNVSRIMDCVGCDKCRLWGKLQTSGYGTALKVLFEFDENDGDGFHLRRTEVVSLIITLQRLSHSISAIEKFQSMILTAENPSQLGRIFSKYFAGVEFRPFGQALHEELHEIRVALKYVLKSYIYLPVNLWNTAIMFMSKLWDQYITRGSNMKMVGLNLSGIFH